MPLTKLEHYLVLTDDLDRTREFNVEVLGMHVGPRPPLAFPGYWVYVGDTPCIHIAEWKTYTAHSLAKGVAVTSPSNSTGAIDHIAFNAVDYDEVLSRLERHGVQARRNEQPGGALRQLFLEDPNGVKIEINVRR